MELEDAKKIFKYLLEDRQIGLAEITDIFYEAIETVLQALKDKEKEIEKLYTIRNEIDYGYENTHIITKNRIVTIEKNKYLIEIEDGNFIDIKELYEKYENSIPKKKIEEKIEEYTDDELYKLDEPLRAVVQELLEEK